MKEAAVSEQDEGSHVSPECFHAYVSAETKIPNTLTAVGPYVGRAALKSFQTGIDLETAVRGFATTHTFSREQMDSAIKTVSRMHGRFGVPVLPVGVDLEGRKEIRLFQQARFEVVYMEGVLNILESILRLHGVRRKKDGPLEDQVAELLEQSENLAMTLAVFAAAEHAINTAESTEKSEAFKERFNFIKTNEKPRAMFPAEKDAIQAEVMPFIITAVRQVLAERKLAISDEQVKVFVFVLTSPELHQEEKGIL
jgi:hypothetical protein